MTIKISSLIFNLIIKSFQDPLSHQLAEAVRIDLRGKNMLNSKAEYSCCRVPRLIIDMEGEDQGEGYPRREGVYSLESGDIHRVKQSSGRTGKTEAGEGC